MTRTLVALLTLAICVSTVTCSHYRTHLSGEYVASGRSSMQQRLVLEPDGNGRWLFDGEPLPLTWDMRENRLLLHTPAGGFMSGTIHHGPYGQEIITLVPRGDPAIIFVRHPQNGAGNS